MIENFLDKKATILKKEKRANKRYKYDYNFKIESVNLKEINLDVLGVNISINGIAFISNISFEKGDMLSIAFKFNNVTIPAIIKVQHVNICDTGFFVGGEFIAMQNMYREVLKRGCETFSVK
ncbi:PilZ domain-containing protein [Clostridium sp. 001]|uniref:PilZ domain-containing protein n=1 Tax=Clostridium sp. 001 TaxID=1970093 RepID=UPI001C2C46DA|nr:PilZ domain-containing protein [Clostridium sp. 001]QXE18894.1 pilus assembly protein PilZ [Clostridium sp. 001]